MKEKNNNRLVVWGIIIVFVGAALLCGYAIFEKNKREEKDDTSKKVEYNVSYKELVGVYVDKDAVFEEDGKKDENGTVIYGYKRLTINEDGTAKFEDKASNSGSYEGEGPLLLGKDKMYILNEECQEMVVVGNSCSWPNCTNLYEFTYKDGKIFIENIELIKK